MLLALFVPDEEVVFRLERLRDSAAVPDEPDRRWVDGWPHRGYLDFWSSLPAAGR